MTDQRRGLLGIYLRGIAMGAADVVPGVSGGTIALITGIYDRLLAALAGADVSAFQLLLKGQWRALWQRLDGSFLLTLLAGIGSAVLLLAELIQWLMQHYPLPLWSFFFGLVAASALWLLREEVPRRTPLEWLCSLAGIAIAGTIALSPAGSFVEGPLGFFLAGALAICAMILPGISGSFILLLLGMYEPVLKAVTSREFLLLGLFIVGCAAGLLAFSRLLHWVLARMRRATMALLAGFLMGSLLTLWPWQAVISTTLDRHGEERPVQTQPISATAYAQHYGESQWMLCLGSMLIGAALVSVAHRLAPRDPDDDAAGAQSLVTSDRSGV